MKADREIVERAVRAVTEQARETDALVHETLEVGLGGSAPLTVHAKLIRQVLLRVKAELERELERLELDRSACGRRVHWVQRGSASAPATGRTESPHRTASLSLRRAALVGVLREVGAGGNLFVAARSSGSPGQVYTSALSHAYMDRWRPNQDTSS